MADIVEYPKHITVNGTVFEATSPEHEAELRAGEAVTGEVPGPVAPSVKEDETEGAEADETVGAGDDPNEDLKDSKKSKKGKK